MVFGFRKASILRIVSSNIFHSYISYLADMASELKYPELSRISKSKLSISDSDYKKYQREIIKVKYPTHAFDMAMSLQQKIQQLKNQRVKKELTSVREKEGLNCYRRVRGDGNCFFRAIAFEYIATLIQYDCSIGYCFPHLAHISLTCCFPESIPKPFREFYDHRFLNRILSEYWEKSIKTAKVGQTVDRIKLIKLFDEYPFLDFILVIYLRSVCLRSLELNLDQEIKNYLIGNEQETIRTYSEESQGIVLNLCSRILKINISVYEIRKAEVVKYNYTAENDPVCQIFLLFNENHYDILEKNEHIDSEKNVLKAKDYYEQVNEKLKKGTCIECKRTSMQIFEESQLCIKCHETSINNLSNFEKEKFAGGRCQQCGFMRQISQTYGLCRSCINEQKSPMAGSIHNQSKKSNLKPTFNSGKCNICKYFEMVEVETGICRNCMRDQAHYGNYYFAKNDQNLARQKDKIGQLREPPTRDRGWEPAKQDKSPEHTDHSQKYNNKLTLNKHEPAKSEFPKQESALYDRKQYDRKQHEPAKSEFPKQESTQYDHKQTLSKYCQKHEYTKPGQCQKCRLPEKLNDLTGRCKDCDTVLCKKCNSSFTPMKNEQFCSKCVSNSEGYNKYKCKKCDKLKISISDRGYCEQCGQNNQKFKF